MPTLEQYVPGSPFTQLNYGFGSPKPDLPNTSSGSPLTSENGHKQTGSLVDTPPITRYITIDNSTHRLIDTLAVIRAAIPECIRQTDRNRGNQGRPAVSARDSCA